MKGTNVAVVTVGFGVVNTIRGVVVVVVVVRVKIVVAVVVVRGEFAGRRATAKKNRGLPSSFVTILNKLNLGPYKTMASSMSMLARYHNTTDQATTVISQSTHFARTSQEPSLGSCYLRQLHIVSAS